MKKLLLLLLLPLALFAEDYSSFIRPMMAVQPDGSRAMTDVYYAFLEAPTPVLSINIPQPALDRTFGVSVDEEGVETSNVTDVTLEEFVIGYATSLDGNKVIIRLAAVSELGKRYRNLIVTEADLDVWNTNLKMFGFTIQKWITYVQYLELMQTAGYNAEL